jgi:hypothetical protein
MSYLSNTRLIFTGRFQADVSTVNNDVRHFDNASFDKVFQEFQNDKSRNGSWNPTGSGAFRLINCRIVMVGYADGSTATSTGDDAAIGMLIAGSEGRTSGKLVDIDPQWQLASAPWGLGVRLADDKEPGFFSGHYKPHAFRDLWFGRMLTPQGTPAPGDGAASATFQSVLENVTWARDLKGSRALAELKAAAIAGLSIRLTTFSYIDRNPNAPDFTLGTVTGAIGPQLAGEPESFILGRRFAPANGITTWNGCSYFSGRVDSTSRTLMLDLSNATQLAPVNSDPTKGPITPVGSLNDIGKLRVGVLKDAAVTEFSPATEDNFLPFGEIDYQTDGWVLNTSGIAALQLNDAQLSLLVDHPLALAAEAPLNAGTGANGAFGQIAIRETSGGYFVEAEPIVHRIDAPGQSTSIIYAARYGKPLPKAQVSISQLGGMPQQGGDQTSGPNTPTAPILPIGVPTTALTIPTTVTTAADGLVSLPIKADNPGNPRKYIDGQLYLIDFRLPGQGNQARSAYDYIVIHVRDVYAVPAEPTWKDDVAPIFTQYANLYPIMSKQLVNLANPHDVKRHAKILRLAFAQPTASPNYMPVTRDLSQGKREMIQKFLDRVIKAGDPTLEAALTQPLLAAPYGDAGPRPDVEHPGAKTVAARNFARVTGLPVVR